MSKIELTRFAKADGPLTKRIWLHADGTVKSDGSACVMARGTAQRMPVNDVDELAQAIGCMTSAQALALGTLRRDLPNQVEIVTKRQLAANGHAIARTATNILYRPGKPAAALVDYDRKGMPAAIAEEVKTRGDLWETLVSIVPLLRPVAHVIRDSTSTGLFRTDTKERLFGSGGQHIYIPVRDGSDIERFLKALHERCWLSKFGWFIIGAGGQLLERSIIDRMVFGPERLVFEGAPILEPPIGQDRERRRPIACDGAVEMLDTRLACPDLDVVERSRLHDLKLRAAGRLKGEATRVRREFEQRQAQALATRTGISLRDAKHQISRQCEGILLPDVALPFDDEDLAGCTVGDVLDDPARFEGATLADPLEGVEYGRCIGRVMRREDGTPWIHSFAHGRAVYKLKHSAASVQALIDKADEKDAAKVLIEMLPVADLTIDDQERLRKYAAERAKIGLRDMSRMLKAAAQACAAKRMQEARERRILERNDPRPRIPRPADDAEWLPQMDVLSGVIGKSNALHPPTRDIDDVEAKGRQIALPKMHAFITSDKPEGGLQ